MLLLRRACARARRARAYPYKFMKPSEHRIPRAYRTVRLGALANFRILHSKISHKTNKQWVRYGTMQSKSGRIDSIFKKNRTFASEGSSSSSRPSKELFAPLVSVYTLSRSKSPDSAGPGLKLVLFVQLLNCVYTSSVPVEQCVHFLSTAPRELCVDYLSNTVALTDFTSWKKVFASRP